MPKRRSWSFDARAFNTWFVGEIVEDDQMQLSRYSALTQRIVDSASGEARQYLETLVVDEQDFAEDGSIHVDKWYAACMANHLTAGPADDHIMLTTPALDVAGWSRDDIDSLITGDQLASLAERSNSPALRNEVAPHLRDRRYGGWLSPERAVELETRLTRVRNLFDHPPREVLDRYPADFRDLPDFLLRAFREAAAVLRIGSEQGLAIRIVTRF